MQTKPLQSLSKSFSGVLPLRDFFLYTGRAGVANWITKNYKAIYALDLGALLKNIIKRLYSNTGPFQFFIK